MIKLITHSDLDGIGCEILLRYVEGIFDNNVDVTIAEAYNVNKIVEYNLNKLENGEYTKLFITDLSISNELAKRIDDNMNVVLLDHHPSAEFLNKYKFANVIIESTRGKTCGTSLLASYYHVFLQHANSQLVKFVELVRQYDTWEWKDKYNNIDAKKLNDLLYILGREKFVNLILKKIINDENLFDETINIILESKQNEINNYINIKENDLIIKEILGYKAGVIMCDMYSSELGNILSEKHPELDFIAIIKQNSIGLRCVKDNVNLTEIAKHFGGGGHKKASGFPLNNVKLNAFINDIFDIKEGD